MRWSMRLLRSDNVVKKSGTPTSASLILALESLHLSATVDTVKSHLLAPTRSSSSQHSIVL